MPRPTFFNLPAEKRERITELAIAEFSEHSYGEASISRIVASSGIAKGSFYQYFDDKLDLYRWLLLDVIAKRKLEFVLAHTPPAGGDFYDRLGGLCLGGMKFALANPRLAQIGLQMRQGTPGQAGPEALHRELAQVTRSYLRSMLEQGQENGHVRRDMDLEVATDCLNAILQQALNESMVRKAGLSVLEFVNHPAATTRLPEVEQERLIASIVDVLRHAFGPATPLPVEDSRPVLDLRSLPYQPGEYTKGAP